MIQLFDSWGGNLSPEDYKRFSLPYAQKIFERVKATGRPAIFYVNDSPHLLELIAQSGANCIGIDWRTSLADARSRLGQDFVLQGNFDPTHLFGSKQQVADEARRMVASLQGTSGYIANLGHGILPTTPRANAITFVKAVQEGWSST